MDQQKVINAGKLAFNLARPLGQPLAFIHYDINEGRLSVDFEATLPCKIDMSLYQAGFFSGTTEKTIYSKSVTEGSWSIRFKPHVLTGFGTKFLIIHVNGIPYFTQRL